MLLQGKSAVITGSTSGIGLGIARALAEQGADILLNGFGPASEISELQKCLAKTYSVRVSYSNADMMSKLVLLIVKTPIEQNSRIAG